MKEYSVIIVGGGPAGIAAAKIFKDNNIDFCIIEKEKFPRLKLCAGGLTNKCLKLLKKLDLKFDNIDSFECKEVKFVSSKRTENMILDNSIQMVDRSEFDYNNIRQVTDGNLFELESVKNVENNVLITDKSEYKFKYIIFADGVNGYSKRLIENRKFGFLVEYNSEKLTDETVMDFCAIPNGYGWIFPKKHYTTIGLGNFTGEKADYVGLLEKFCKKYAFYFEKSKVKGYHIPVYSKTIYKKSVINNKCIIVGDAASLTDNVSGEGIYYALLSGKIAAESIIETFNNSQNLKQVYFRNSKAMATALAKRQFLSKLLYSKYGNFFIKLGLSNKYFVRKINSIFG